MSINYLPCLRSKIDEDAFVSPNFRWREYLCRCGTCEVNFLHYDLFPRLERLRELLGGNAITITSGYRCLAHNKAVNGANRSRHLEGDAVDVKVAGVDPAAVARDAWLEGLFNGIKTYPTWTHLDLRPGKAWLAGDWNLDR